MLLSWSFTKTLHVFSQFNIYEGFFLQVKIVLGIVPDESGKKRKGDGAEEEQEQGQE